MTRVLVLGATGRQGGAVARQLVERGHEVSALVRDPDTPNVSAVAALGVRIVAGDLRDPAAVRRAVVGHDAVFGLTVPFGPGGRAEEIQSGKALVDAAAETHLVFSSVRGGDRLDASGVDHADSKQVIEAYLRDRPVRSTVIGPVYFMDNALAVDFNGLRRGVLSTPLSPNKRLDQVAVADIAGMAVYAIEHPDTMIGRRVDIASDSVTGTEAAETLSRVIGRDIPYAQLPLHTVRERAGEEFVSMWESFERNEYFLDIASLHAEYPEVGWHSFEQWALAIDWEKILAAKASW
ncbi:NmrA family transcriptional regulator [Enemella evansiae]|uniref:NmrA family transcriptional regulator n=1 Tax=Enemella evansiae TaxID=2016499 RepID=A0A255FYS8_9ACTN|nr:NmrA/HSCARG family protein [Enemella evansiae]OYO08849.1 NmrA family transcriptional regulator [Enemella evansiae]